MKSVSGKLLFSFIVSWVALVGLSKVYDFALLHNCNIKASYIQKNKIDADLLIHGPCQALWIVRPSIIEKKTHLKTYNLGLTHADFADNYLHLYLYLKHNKAPQYLFLYVSPESMDLNYNMFNTYRFAPFAGDVIVDSVLKECDSAYFKWISIPFMKYGYYNNATNFDAIQGLKHFFTNKTTPYFQDNGYEPPFNPIKESDPNAFVQIYPDGFKFVWNTLREKYLRKTIELAQQHNIRVYLYESPLLKKAVLHLPNRTATLQKIKSLADEYGIEFVRFENMKMADSVSYFFSTVGMTTKGSQIFSDSLGTYIKNYVTKEEQP